MHQELGIKILTQQHYRPQVFIRFYLCISLCLSCVTSLSFPKECWGRHMFAALVWGIWGYGGARMQRGWHLCSFLRHPSWRPRRPFSTTRMCFSLEFFWDKGLELIFFQGTRHVKSWQLPSAPTTHREEFELTEPLCNALYSLTPTVLWSTVRSQQVGL